MCELLVGLAEVNVLGIDDVIGGRLARESFEPDLVMTDGEAMLVVDQPLRVHAEVRISRPGSAGCGVFAHVKDRPIVELGGPAVLRSADPRQFG